jgi:hypothetical protein
MVIQLGALHPAKVNGEWKIVLEPWAKIENDPRQPECCNYYGSDNKFYAEFAKLKEQGVRVIDLGEETPSVRWFGLGRLQHLDHHRIRAARDLRMGIVVSLSSIETFN